MHFRVGIGLLLVFLGEPVLAREGTSPNWKFQMNYVVDSTGVGWLSEPSWSIEGDFLVVKGRGGLFVYNHSSRPAFRHIRGHIYQHAWLPGNKLVYELRENRISELHLLDPSTGNDRALLSAPVHDLKRLQATIDGRIAFTNEGRNVEWKVDIVDTNGTRTFLDQTSISNLVWDQNGVPWIRKNGATRPIFNDWPGRIWGAVKASPHGDFVAAQVQVDDAVRTAIFTGEGKRFDVLPIGFMPSQWSSDDRILIGYETTDDGHSITSSKLTLFDVQSKDYTVIPTPDGMMPTNPTWSEATGRVAFMDEDRGLIVVGTLRETTK
jgi:hypothetical protein